MYHTESEEQSYGWYVYKILLSFKELLDQIFMINFMIAIAIIILSIVSIMCIIINPILFVPSKDYCPTDCIPPAYDCVEYNLLEGLPGSAIYAGYIAIISFAVHNTLDTVLAFQEYWLTYGRKLPVVISPHFVSSAAEV